MDKSAVHTRSPPPRVDNDGKDTRGVPILKQAKAEYAKLQ